ncbi:MAG: TIGR02099 family protein [Gammaproteobacteria bacterium]|nr:TIGR02099 family protein [Gammaproteobacteria bacterium]
MPHQNASGWTRALAASLPWLGGLLLAIAVLGMVVRLALPGIAAYQSEIQDAVSGFLGRPIRIDSVQGGWAGWTPYLMLRGFTAFDDAGSTPLLRFAEARISLDSPASLRHAALRPHSLVLATPELRLVRLMDGAITIEGIAAQSDRALRWLLAQPRISLAAERVTWHDRRAGRGPYTLTQARLDVERHGEIRRLRLRSAAHHPLGRRIEVAIEAKGDLITLGAGSGWQGEVYAEAHGLDAGLLLDYARTLGLAAASGRVGLRLWGTWRDGRMTGAAGRLRVRSLRVPLGKAAWEVLRGDVWFGVGRGEAGDTSLTLDRLVLHTPKGTWPETRLRFTLGAREGNAPGSLLAECGYLRVEDVLPFVPSLLSIEHRDLLERAAPGGEVRDLRVFYDPRRDDLYARADLRGVAADPVPGYALFRGLIATVELNQDRGRLALSGAPLELGGRSLFPASLPIERLAGEIAWQRQGSGWRFTGHDLRATVPGFEAHASGHLTWVAGLAPVVDLRVGLSHGDVARVPQYLPGASPRALREWLERALVAGRIVGGGMELQGPLDRFPFDAREGRFRAQIDVERGVLDHTAGWPRIEDISARVVFEGRSLDIRASQGRVLGATLEETHVRIADLGAGEPVLEIRGRATGPATSGRQFLLDSPLREVAGGAMRQLAPDGSVTVNLMLDLPLGSRPHRLSGQVRFSGNTIRTQDIAFSDVTGELTFTDHRWGARGLAARLFGRPVTIDVDGGGAVDGGAGIPLRVRITGRADRAFLQARMAEFLPAAADPAWLTILDGETDLEASAEISPAQGTGPDDLTIRSSLEGLAIRAPPPLGKSAGVVRPIEITTRTEAGGRWFRFRYADIAHGEILMGAAPKRPQLERLVVRLGRDQRVPPAGPRSWVGGWVSRLALSEWQRFLDGLPVTQPQGRPQERLAWPLPLIDIEVADFEALGLHLGHLGIRASRAADAWTVALDGEEARGTLRIPHSPQVPIEARFERLTLFRDGSAGPLETLDPSRLPGLVFECRHCVFGSTALGRVRLKTQPGPEGLSIYDVAAAAEAFDLAAVGIWQGAGGASSSRFDIEVRGPDLGTVLGAFGYTLPLEGGKTDLKVQARWPGSPADFTLGGLQGTLEIDVLDGRFLEVNQGVGRLFGLLSVHALQRRLRLDFSDIFSKGFAFDRIGGAFSITGRDAYTNDLVMEGPSARIDISGRVGLVRRDYDQWVTVTPSIAGTLPLGAAVLLAQQVFSGLPERINKMLERRYRVTGGWDQPVVTRSDGEQAPEPGAGP